MHLQCLSFHMPNHCRHQACFYFLSVFCIKVHLTSHWLVCVGLLCYHSKHIRLMAGHRTLFSASLLRPVNPGTLYDIEERYPVYILLVTGSLAVIRTRTFDMIIDYFITKDAKWNRWNALSPPREKLKAFDSLANGFCKHDTHLGGRIYEVGGSVLSPFYFSITLSSPNHMPQPAYNNFLIFEIVCKKMRRNEGAHIGFCSQRWLADMISQR
jgi:hypothetical protein